MAVGEIRRSLCSLGEETLLPEEEVGDWVCCPTGEDSFLVLKVVEVGWEAAL